MKKFLLACSVGLVAFASHAADMKEKETMDKMDAVENSCKAHPKYATWKEAKITADIHQALNIFKQNLPAKSKLKRVSEVRVLNEDGRYIAFEVELDNGQYWNGVIHHNPRGDYLVDRVLVEGKLCG
ncbi:hypothetical protein [Vibrio taketomensis]|uniref:hypothetical protein n=1 Tax=Vibrio taketomensis TaxID=2572923 RepID=UPI001389C950|nr:hypothetical protein [Vibrio taketomensis]